MHRICRTTLQLLAGALAIGCAPSFEAHQQAKGSYSSLQAFEVGSLPWAAALGGDRANALTLVSLGDARRCQVDDVEAFSVATNDHGVAIVTWTREAPGCGALGFVDASCRPLMDPLRCNEAPAEVQARVLGDGFEDHIFIRTTSGVLWLVDPWDGASLALGSQVTAWRWADASSIWLVDGGTLSLRELDSGEARPFAEGVREAIFLTGGGVAYVDEQGLWWLRSAAHAPALIAPDACEAREAKPGASVAVLSPCGDRRLIVQPLAGGDAQVVASGVDAFRADTQPLFYTAGDALYAHDGTGAVHVADQASLDSLRRVSHDGQLSHLLLSGTTLLSFDGVTTTPFITDVSSFDVRHDYVAALVGASDGIGRLMVRSEAGGSPALVARGVPAHRYGFASALEALAFLRDYDGTRGTLEISALTSADRYVIDHGVSELAEVRSAALPGVAYLIPDGDRAGIWFATPE